MTIKIGKVKVSRRRKQNLDKTFDKATHDVLGLIFCDRLRGILRINASNAVATGENLGWRTVIRG